MQYLKSYEGYVLGLYRAILSDIVLDYPSLHAEFERDYKRLCSAVEHHGLQFLLVTMNEFGKHFDRCLSLGHLAPAHLCHFGIASRRERIPRLFKGLVLRVFDRSGVLELNPDVKAIRALRQLFYTAKKLKLDCPDSSTWEQVNEFVKVDCQNQDPTLNWTDPNFNASDARSLSLCDSELRFRYRVFGEYDSQHNDGISITEQRRRLAHLQRVFDIVSSFIGRFDPYEWRFRHGPGAVSIKPKEDYKYLPQAWSERLERVFPYADFGFANFGAWADTAHHDPQMMATSDEEPSRLIAVPKTHSAPRLIAAEPTANQWCQQSLMDFFVDRVNHTFMRKSIKFDDQSQNGKMALQASDDGLHATVDLKAASDRISCWLVERFFRSNPSVLDALQACRTGWVRQDIDKKQPKYIKLRKFSTMGSACTFPVQTIIFYSMAISAVLYQNELEPSVWNVRRYGDQVSVFGDDIILPTYALGRLQADMANLGLEVNDQKTFGTGRFRESCGVDAFGGHDVTPTYILAQPAVSKPGSVVSAVDSANNFFLRGYWTASLYIQRTVLGLRRYVFPYVAPNAGVLGWYTHEDLANNDLLKDRWNAKLQRREYLYDRPFDRSRRTPPRTNAGLLEYFGIKPVEFIRDDRLGPVSQQRSLKLRRAWDTIG